MRNLVATVCILFGLTLLMAGSAHCQDLEDAKHSVLKFRGASRDAEWKCSAVVIRPGRALTAAHCVDRDNADFTIAGRTAYLVEKNRLLDLAMVQFLPKDEVPLLFAPKPVKMGTDVAIIGYALGKPDMFMQFGHVANARTGEDEFVLDVAAFHGDSGGAVVNKRLELVGIIVAGEQDDAQEQIFAVSLATIQDFLEGCVKCH